MSICLQDADYLPLGHSNSTLDIVKTMRLINSMLLMAVPFLFMAVGTVGNLINLVVLFRKAFSKRITCTAITLRFLAYMDLVVLWTSVSRLLFMGLYDVDVRLFSFQVCSLHKFWHFFCICTTNWTIALIAFTRYIRMTYPFRVHILFSQCRIYFTLVIIVVLSGSSSLIYYKNYVGTGLVHHNCDICVLSPSSDTFVFKLVQLVPVYFIPGCLLLFFHWRIIVNYQLMVERRDKLRSQFYEIVHRISELKKKIEVKESKEQSNDGKASSVQDPPPVRSSSSPDLSNIVPSHDEKLTPVLKSLRTALKKKDSKKIRFSHVVDLETAKVEIISCCSVMSLRSCSSVDPSLETDKNEIKKIMLIKEERNLRRIRAAYGLLWLAAQSDDYLMWDNMTMDVSRKKRRDMLDCINYRGEGQCCMLRSPTLRVMVACASIVFILFNTPFCVWYTVSHLIPSTTMLETSEKNVAFTVVTLLTYFCNTVNFILYSTLSSKFQSELCRILTCCKGSVTRRYPSKESSISRFSASSGVSASSADSQVESHEVPLNT